MRKVAEKDIDRKGKKKVLIEGDKKKENQVDQEYTSRKSKEEKRRRTGGQGYEGTGATLDLGSWTLDLGSWTLVVFRSDISSNAYRCKKIRRIIGIYRKLVKLFRPTGVSHVHRVVVAVKSS
jgi:hypothetical protein